MTPDACNNPAGIIFVPLIDTMKKILLMALVLAAAGANAQKITPALQQSIDSGKELYMIYCQSCHMEQGEGLEGVFPPVAKSDYLMADKTRAIRLIINGISGPMKVNKVAYDGEMQGYPLSDKEVADVINFIRNSFGNKGGSTTTEEVAAARK